MDSFALFLLSFSLFCPLFLLFCPPQPPSPPEKNSGIGYKPWEIQVKHGEALAAKATGEGEEGRAGLFNMKAK